MTLASRHLALAVVAVVIWAAITLVVPTIMLDSRTSLTKLITGDLAWGVAGDVHRFDIGRNDETRHHQRGNRLNTPLRGSLFGAKSPDAGRNCPMLLAATCVTFPAGVSI